MKSKSPLKIKLFFSSYRLPFCKIKFATFSFKSTDLLKSKTSPINLALILIFSKSGFLSNFSTSNFKLPLKFLFNTKSPDKISLKKILLDNIYLNLKLSKVELISKLNGSKKTFPAYLNLLFPIKELSELNTIMSSFNT